jgi:hypothetical protein
VVATIVAAAAVAASCCGPVATVVGCGGSPVAVASPAARDALDECRLVGTDSSDLSALAGASAGTYDITLRTKRHETKHQPLETSAHGENATYLRLEKPRFLFLEGSVGAAVAPVVAAATLTDAPAALAGASAVRVASSADRPAVGAPAVVASTGSAAAPTARGDGGGGLHLSGGAALCRSPLPPLMTTSSRESSGGGALAARATNTLRFLAPGALDVGFSFPSCVPPAPFPAAVWRGWTPGPGASVDPTARRPRSPSANGIH